MADITLPTVHVVGKRAPIDPNEVFLYLDDGTVLTGWKSVRVSRGIERVPSDFEIVATDPFPGQVDLVPVLPGQACEIRLGHDTVLTGYVDRVLPTISPGSHSVTVVGRGKCQDLVDCSAMWPSGQIAVATVLELASKLAEPYGIAVTAAPGQDIGPLIPQFNLTFGTPAFSVIEEVCRYRGLLAYELADGSLLLSRASDKQAASGFQMGKNIIAASGVFAVDQRYRQIEVLSQSLNTLGDLGEMSFMVAEKSDGGVKRLRNLTVMCESAAPGFDISEQRAQWELNRRFGRGFQIRVVTDSWRDAAGNLYEPNTLAPLDIPALKVTGESWTVSEVTYRRDQNGTTCEVALMPPQAFDVQPILLQQWPDVKNLPKS